MGRRYVRRALIGVVMLGVMLFALATPVLAQGAQFVFGEDFTLKSGDELTGGLAVFGGSVVLETGSQVNGDVFNAGGDMDVAGRITGSLTVLGGNVHLGADAVVMGDLVAAGGTVTQDEGAVVLGERVSGGEGGLVLPEGVLPPLPPDVPVPVLPGGMASAGLNFIQQVVVTIFSALALAALGVVLLLFLERPVRRMEDCVLAVPWAGLGMGLLTLVVVAAVSTILAITVCLSPVALLLLLVLMVALLLGWTVAGLIVGERILTVLKVPEPSPLLSAVIGVVLITLLTRIPCLGWLLGLLTASLGLGAVVLTRAGTVPYPVVYHASGAPLPAADGTTLDAGELDAPPDNDAAPLDPDLPQ